MRVMVIVKATKSSEAGAMPTQEQFAAMAKYNMELAQAGIMIDGDGLHPSSRGKRVRFADGRSEVLDGPFANTKELVSGFWIWKVKSMDEAVEWALRCPMPGEEAELELRPFFEEEDFGEALTPELRAQEQAIRTQVDARR